MSKKFDDTANYLVESGLMDAYECIFNKIVYDHYVKMDYLEKKFLNF